MGRSTDIDPADPRVDGRSEEQRAEGPNPEVAQQRRDPEAVAEAKRVEKERIAAEKKAQKAVADAVAEVEAEQQVAREKDAEAPRSGPDES